MDADGEAAPAAAEDLMQMNEARASPGVDWRVSCAACMSPIPRPRLRCHVVHTTIRIKSIYVAVLVWGVELASDMHQSPRRSNSYP